MTAWSNNEIFDLKISKKGKIFLGKKKNDNSKIVAKGHNKEKNYIYNSYFCSYFLSFFLYYNISKS